MRTLPVLLLLAVGCAMDTDPSEIAGTSAPLAATPDEWLPALGVQTGRGLGADDLVPFGLNGMALVRVNFVFRVGQTAAADGSVVPEHFDWIVDVHARNGVSILPVLIGVDDHGARFISDTEMPLWRKFCETMAARYGPGGAFWTEHPDVPALPIRAWEVWNEPNLETFWDASPTKTRPNPRRYRRILRAAHEGLRAADPRARVVLAGLAFPHKRPNMPWKPFLRDVLGGDSPAARERNRCLFDAIAIHPYGESVRSSVETVERVHRFMESEGLTGRDRDRDVQLWITEVGWSVPVEGLWPRCRKMEDGVCTRWRSELTVDDETQQAHRVHALLEKLEHRRARWRLGPVLWYNFEDVQYSDDPAMDACTTDPKWWCFSGAWTRHDRGRRPRPMWQALGDRSQQDGTTRVLRLPPVRCADVDPSGLAADDSSDAASEGAP